MTKYQKKNNDKVDVITFDEFVEYAKNNSEKLQWGFSYCGHEITKENDAHYLISTKFGYISFTPSEVLILDSLGDIVLYSIEYFNTLYEKCDTQSN